MISARFLKTQEISGPVVFEHHLIKRSQKRPRGRHGLFAPLILTPMVDVFSMLVVFLLQAFSSGPEILVTKGLSLPSSITAQEVGHAPTLAATAKEVFFDQKLVGPLGEVLRRPELLGNLLGKHQAQGQVNFQADRGLPSTVVAQIMNILNARGITSVHLAAIGKAP